MERPRVATAKRALAWVLAGVLMLWTLARTAGIDHDFPAAALIGLTPWVAAVSLPLALAALLLGARAAAAAAAACAVVLIAQVAPRAFSEGPPEPRPTGPEIRILAANLLYGNAPLGPIVDLVRDEDIDLLAISELTPEAAARVTRSPLSRLLPHQNLDPRAIAAGTGLLSRHPLRTLPAPGTNGLDAPTVISSVSVPGAAPVEASAIHPRPPTSFAAADSNDEYVASLPPTGPAGPVRILAGDFNVTLDHSVFRDLLERGYTDAADAAGDGLRPTFSFEGVPLVAIDHVLVDERVEVLDHRVVDLPGSDHEMVLVSVRLPAGG